MASNNKIRQFIRITKKQIKTYFGLAIFIVLFIQFFQPFAIDNFDFENKLLYIAGFGLIAFVMLIAAQAIFQKHLLRAEEEIQGNNFQIPLYFFVLVAATSLAFNFYIRYVGQTPVTFNVVVRNVLICLSLPVVLYLKNKTASNEVHLKKLMLEMRILQDKLKKFAESTANKSIEIESENESDNFRILVSEIVYLKSADNYVEIGYHEAGAIKKRMVRNTLKNIEKQLAEYNDFIRTHRTSLVNIKYVEKLNKNFNSYWLSLEHTKESVPVSRQYLMAVKGLL